MAALDSKILKGFTESSPLLWQAPFVSNSSVSIACRYIILDSYMHVRKCTWSTTERETFNWPAADSKGLVLAAALHCQVLEICFGVRLRAFHQATAGRIWDNKRTASSMQRATPWCSQTSCEGSAHGGN